MAKVGRLVKDMVVQQITSTLKERPSFFVTTMGPLPAADADSLRKRLASSQARMVMVKRRLGLRGVADLKIDGMPDLFTGSIALVFPGEDIVPAAKLLVEFAKANQDKVIIRGGVVEGQLLNTKRVEEVASLPSRPQLLANVVGAIEAPMTDLIFTVERVLGDLAYVLEEAGKRQLAASGQ